MTGSPAAAKDMRWQSYDQPGYLAARRSSYQAVELALTNALQKLNEQPHPDDARVINLLQRLMTVCQYAGKLDEAEQYAKLAIQFSERQNQKIEKPDSSQPGSAQVNTDGDKTDAILIGLAQIYRREKKLSLAELTYRKVIDHAALRPSDPQSQQVLLRALVGLAEVQAAGANYSLSIASFQKALASARDYSLEWRPGDHVRYAQSLYMTGKLSDTESELKAALDSDEQNCGADQPPLAATLNDLAVVFLKEGHDAQAEQYMRRAVAIVRKFHYADLPDWLDNLAEVLQAQNKKAEAQTLSTEAQSLRKKNAPTASIPIPPSM